MICFSHLLFRHLINQLKQQTMKTLDFTYSLGKNGTSDGIDGIDINKVNISNLMIGELNIGQVQKIIERVKNEPTFRLGKLETDIYGFQEKDKNEIVIELGLFDEWGGEDNEDGDVWGESETYKYQLSDFS
jgi:hypothetical protein